MTEKPYSVIIKTRTGNIECIVHAKKPAEAQRKARQHLTGTIVSCKEINP